MCVCRKVLIVMHCSNTGIVFVLLRRSKGIRGIKGTTETRKRISLALHEAGRKFKCYYSVCLKAPMLRQRKPCLLLFPVCVCVYVCVCVCVCMCMCLCVSLHVCNLSKCVHVRMCMCLCVYPCVLNYYDSSLKIAFVSSRKKNGVKKSSLKRHKGSPPRRGAFIHSISYLN